MSLAEELAELPDGVAAATQVIAGLDDCLRTGFARLTETHRDALSLLVGTLSESPLGEALAEAVDACGRSEFVVRHFVLLATARAALQGAQYDALRGQLLSAVNHSPQETDPVVFEPAGEASAVLSSVQQWLMELAIGGFQHLEESQVAPFVATLEQLQSHAKLTGLASLLTGFVNELLRCMPAEKQTSLPVFRWADLWAAAFVRTQQVAQQPVGKDTSGVLTPLGADVRSHENFALATVFGVLETDSDSRCVKIPLSSYKVDVVGGAEIWDLFGDVSDPLLKALETGKCLKIDNAELRSDGDLILRSKPKLGRAAKPFSLTDQIGPLPAVAPLMRHPVQLAELVVLDGDHGFEIATERLSDPAEITASVMKSARQVIGLLRFDREQWRLQPLCVDSGKAVITAGESLLKVRTKLKSKTLAILKERSGRLLRG